MDQFDIEYSQKLNDFEIPRVYMLVFEALTMLTHLSYAVFFFWNSVTFMGFFNIFSVAFYTYGIVAVACGTRSEPLIKAALVEIVAHATVATLFMGWDYGFQMYLICMVAVPFMFSLRQKFDSFALSIAIIAIYFTLRIACVYLGFTIGDCKIHSLDKLWFITNGVLSMVILVLVVLVFRAKVSWINHNLELQNIALKETASLDALTGLFNRRAMGGYLDRIVQSGLPYIAALLDIDFFKKVNDTYGHAAGDIVLTDISALLLKEVPAEGYVCRWGGEEILMIVPDMSLEQGKELAERLRVMISQLEFDGGGSTYGVTVTIGVSEKTSAEQTSDAVIKIADDRLYKGKSMGRNMVVSE